MKRAQYGDRGKPWEAEGISKATWYRRHANDANIVSPANIVSRKERRRPNMGPRQKPNIVLPPLPRLVVIAADPPCLLDRLPREVLSPHALHREASPSAGPTGETAANTARVRLFESEDAAAKRRIFADLESEDEPEVSDPVEEEFQRQLKQLREANARAYAN